MRAVLVAILIALSMPALAQTQTGARTRAGGDITKDEYLERARRAAEKRFDRMDSNHDGVLTLEERRAARGQRKSSRSQ
jgi:hypothetical protein